MGVALVVIAALILVWLVYDGQMFNRRDRNISKQLRALLLARATGELNEEEFQRRQAALHALLLDQPKPSRTQTYWSLGLTLVIIVAAGGIYFWYAKPLATATKTTGDIASSMGASNSFDTQFGTNLTPPKQPSNVGGDLNVVVKRLAEKMAKHPDGDGWLLLARTYTEINQMKEAAAAYAKAAALLPPNANLYADWANAHVVSHGGQWDAEAKDIVKRALEADSKHVKALSLAGSEAFSRKDYKTAIPFWKRMHAASEVGSMDAKLAEANLKESEALLSGKKAEIPSAKNTLTSVSVAGTLTLDTSFKTRVTPTDTVFIVAKAPDGSNPPLAVKRFTVSELPLQFKLDDSAAMLPSRTLSQYSEVILYARISKSGQATPAPGDIAAQPVTVKMGNQQVKLLLSIQQ